MPNRYLSYPAILFRLGIGLCLLTGVLYICSDIHTAANRNFNQRAENLRRWFVISLVQNLSDR